MSVFTLEEVPGYVDIPDSAVEAEKLALAFPLQAQLGNAKFGMARTECFRYFLRDGDEVPLPVSPIDGYQYTREELLYHWNFFMTANPEGGRTSAPGNLLYLDARVEQWGQENPGKVHCSVWYHMQGGATTQTDDGLLTVSVIAQRGIGTVRITGLPAEGLDLLQPGDYVTDAAYTESRAQAINQRAKNSIVSHEYFYLGEFKHGDTLPLNPVSPIDGYVYGAHPQDRVARFFAWRHTADPCSGKAGFQDGGDECGKGGFWGTIRRLKWDHQISGNVFTIEVTYYRRTTFASSTKVTNDGLMAVFAFCRRGVTVVGGFTTAAFLDQDPAEFMTCKGLFDGPLSRLIQNVAFAERRPEYSPVQTYTTNLVHGNTVVPITETDGYAYSIPEEMFYFWEMRDTGGIVPLPDGALLQWKMFIAKSGMATIETNYWEPDGEQSNVHTGNLAHMNMRFRGGNGDPEDPATRGEALGDSPLPITIYVTILSADGIESATYVEADSAPLFLPAGTPDFTALITVRANGVADAQRGASAYIQITNGSITEDSNIKTIGDVDSGQGELTVDDPPTGRVTVKLFLKKNTAASWTGNVGATVKVPQVQGAG